MYCNQLTPLLTVFQLISSQEQESVEALSDAFQRSTPTKEPLLVKSFGRNGSLNRNVLSTI